MKTIAVIGAGAVGAHIVSAGILKNVPVEFLLVDVNEHLEQGQVLDLRDSVLFSDAKNISGASFGDQQLSHADIFIITAGCAQKPGETRTDLLRKNNSILRSISDGIGNMKDSAIVIVVTNPVDILTELAQNIFNLPRSQVFGTGTLLDSSRMKWHVAEQCGVHPKNVSGYVLGEHGDSEFIAWSRVRVAGKNLDSLLSSDQKKEIEHKTQREAYEIIERKGATFFGIGAATIEIVLAVLGDLKNIIPVSYSLHGEFGLHNVSVGVPCVIGASGVESVWDISLDEDEQQKLHSSAEKLKGFLQEYQK